MVSKLFKLINLSELRSFFQGWFIFIFLSCNLNSFMLRIPVSYNIIMSRATIKFLSTKILFFCLYYYIQLAWYINWVTNWACIPSVESGVQNKILDLIDMFVKMVVP